MDMLYLDTIDVYALGREKSAEKVRKVVLLNRANSDFRCEHNGDKKGIVIWPARFS